MGTSPVKNVSSTIDLGQSNRRRATSVPRGFTLIEIVTVLVLLTALLGGTISLVSVASGSDKQSKANLIQRQELRRFADDFRRDAHTTADLSAVSTNESSISFAAAAGGKVIYQIQSSSTVTRTAEDSEGNLVGSDSYGIGIDGEIEIRRPEASDLIEWTIIDSNTTNEAIRIVAAVEETS